MDTAQDVDTLVLEAQRLGIKVDGMLTRWRTKYPATAVDGVLARVPAGLQLTLNGRSSAPAQAHVLREAIKAVDVEPSGPEWENFPELDSWLKPIVAPHNGSGASNSGVPNTQNQD